MHHRVRQGLSVVVLSSVLALCFAQSAASQTAAVTVSGSGVCQESTGLFAVTFAVWNGTGTPISITRAVVAGVPGGGELSVDPNPIPAGGSGGGLAFVPGSGPLVLMLEVSYTHDSAQASAYGTVTTAGGCVPRGTVVSTSTTLAPAASTPASTAAHGVVVSPRFAG